MFYLYPVITHCQPLYPVVIHGYPLPLVDTCYDPSSPDVIRYHSLGLVDPCICVLLYSVFHELYAYQISIFYLDK